MTNVVLLSINQFAPFPIILASRFYGKQAGILEAIAISLYSAFLGYKILYSPNRAKWRRIIWLIFSIVFFSQLFLGLLGYTQFLQTGSLHYPLPALIISGPIYRMEGIFMLGLYLSTLILSGPSWCSHLCYIGAIDNWFASAKSPPKILKYNLKLIRSFSLFLSITIPITLILLERSSIVTHTIVIIALVITLLSFYISSRMKAAFYCSHICPIGIISNVFGKINPLRLRIIESCDSCGACRKKCKYSAINKHNGKMRINYRCTFCMDCTSICHKKSIGFSVWNSSKLISDELFYSVVLTLHGVFLACARI